MKPLPPLNALQVFEVAARLLSFQNAALELNVTPSAVSHQIRQLESYLDKKLFHRLDKRVTLTSDGQQYFDEIQPALKSIAVATSALTRPKGISVLTISAAPVMATRWLMPRIYRFQEPNSDLEIRIHASTEVADFSKSDVDVAIRYGQAPWKGLVSHEIFKEILTPVCCQDFLKKGHHLNQITDLVDLPLLQGIPKPYEWSDWLREFGLERSNEKQDPTFQSRAQALEAAALGLGVVLTDLRLVQQELALGTLVAPLKESATNSSAFYLVYPQSYEKLEKIKRFRDWILSEVEKSGR